MKLDNFPLYPEKILSSLDLAVMTPCEFGIWSRIFYASYIQENPCFIKNDEKKLIKISGATQEQWDAAKEIVLKEFKEKDGYLYNEVLLSVYKKQMKDNKKLNKQEAIELTGLMNYPFEQFWNDYDKKVGSYERLVPKWMKLSDKDRELIKADIPKRKLFQPNKKFRPNAETYLNQKGWTHELIDFRKPEQKRIDTANHGHEEDI